MIDDPLRVLFVCSRNQWRSRTAETLFRNRMDLHVRSAGTAQSARVRLSAKLVEWAEVIVVMEDHHKARIRQDYRHLLGDRSIEVLHIADDYTYMDAMLVQLLETAVQELFGDDVVD